MKTSIRKIKVIGFPFHAEGYQSHLGLQKSGSVQVPAWLSSQHWFRNLKNVEYETVKINEKGSASSESRILSNSHLLQKHTVQAFKDGYYPIVIGGDNTQALGALLGTKAVLPESKAIVLDSKIDLNLEGDDNFSAMQYLTGIAGASHGKTLDLTQDLAFVGVHTKNESYQYVQKSGGTIVGRYHILYQDMSQIHDLIHRKLMKNMAYNLWISCSLNVLDSSSFLSDHANALCNEQQPGISPDFIPEFIKSFSDESVGLDLSDVNIETDKPTQDGQRQIDAEQFRDLFEQIVDAVQQDSGHDQPDESQKKIKLILSKKILEQAQSVNQKKVAMKKHL